MDGLRENASLTRFLYAIADLSAVAMAALLAYWWKFGHLDLPIHYRVAVLLVTLVVLLVFPLIGPYGMWRPASWWSELRRLTAAVAGVAAVMVATAFLLKVSAQFSREWSGYWVILAGLLLLGNRGIVRGCLRWMHRRGVGLSRVLVVGTGSFGAQVARAAGDDELAGHQIVGFVDDPDFTDRQVPSERILGNIESLDTLVTSHAIDEVWICLPFKAEATIRRAQAALRYRTVTQRLLPDMGGQHLMRQPVTEVAGFPAVDLTWTPMGGVNLLIKALEDRLLAALILVLVSPLMLLIAVGVKLHSPGPVFYRQTRVSWNGRPFEMLKFRSMPVGVEVATGPVWNRRDDSRARGFGALLRRTSLDELPQFINVLKGDMSIVGPRPERPVFVERFKTEIPGYMQKHLVKAGITGWAQVNGWRGDTDLAKRIEHDLYYIENWSLWLDLKIIALTVFRGFLHPNAN